MNFIDLLLHLAAFSLPAFALGLLLPLASRFGDRVRPVAPGYLAQAAIVFLAGWLVLAAGLVLSGQDGRMATYGALVLVAGTVQWALVRGWRR